MVLGPSLGLPGPCGHSLELDAANPGGFDTPAVLEVYTAPSFDACMRLRALCGSGTHPALSPAAPRQRWRHSSGTFHGPGTNRTAPALPNASCTESHLWVCGTWRPLGVALRGLPSAPVAASVGPFVSPDEADAQLLRDEAGVFFHVVAIILLGMFLGGVIVGIVAAAIFFSLRRDRRSPPFRVPRKEDD
jgi:hypothetical protein